jgi:predicted nucleic acid-binding protein
MELLLGLGITSVRLAPSVFGRCFLWMKTKGVTFYDASYLALAVESKGILVTADEKFARKMENEGDICVLKNLVLT